MNRLGMGLLLTGVCKEREGYGSGEPEGDGGEGQYGESAGGLPRFAGGIEVF